MWWVVDQWFAGGGGSGGGDKLERATDKEFSQNGGMTSISCHGCMGVTSLEIGIFMLARFTYSVLYCAPPT